MESQLLGQLFRKLLDALRINKGPTRAPTADDVGSRLKQAFAVIVDGLSIRGEIFFPKARPSRLYPALIICHGIPGSGAPRPADDPGYSALAEDFASLGMIAVIFNFRGCGDSDGNFQMMGWVRDLDMVLDRILNTPFVDPTRVMLLGFSGGGAAAVRVAADSSGVYSLAVVGTPSDFGTFEKDPEEIISDFKKRGIIRDPEFPSDIDGWVDEFRKIEPRRWVSHFKGKHLLVVHGDADELIPVEQARELFNSAPAGVAELSIIPQGAHRLRLDNRCVDILKDWFLKTLGWRE
jgi:uncharacterized protein